MERENRVAVILAGGKASRMKGVDKATLLLWGQPLIEHTLDRLQGKVGQIAISVNGDAERFIAYDLGCIEDVPIPDKSPLVGILSALEYFALLPAVPDYLLCLPVDVPVFPESIIDELFEQAQRSKQGLAYVEVGGRVQPLFSVWPLSIRSRLRAAIQAGERGVMRILAQLGAEALTVTSESPMDFVNVNSPEQLETLSLLSRGSRD